MQNFAQIVFDWLVWIQQVSTWKGSWFHPLKSICNDVWHGNWHFGMQLVGSDHGMTDGGNHGGASYQETDSLALFILGKDKSNPSYDLHPQILSHKQHPNMGLSISRTSYQVCWSEDFVLIEWLGHSAAVFISRIIPGILVGWYQFYSWNLWV
jgi:hypothetical protein